MLNLTILPFLKELRVFGTQQPFQFASVIIDMLKKLTMNIPAIIVR